MEVVMTNKNDKFKRALTAEALNDLILDLFRVNSLLLSTGDRLVKPLGLTSARWQILGALIATKHTVPVAWLARNMGANRQNVQRIVNDLRKEGLVDFQSNPHHKRAKLVVLTEKGRQTFDGAMSIQVPWINNLADGLPTEELKTTHNVIKILRDKLEKDASA